MAINPTQDTRQRDASSDRALPVPRRIGYLCQAEDGTLFHISAVEYSDLYTSFKLFAGDGTDMREIAVYDVARYRGVGTMYVYTVEGTFFGGSLFAVQDNPMLPKWNSRQLTVLNKDDFDIVETPKGKVTITKR